MPQRLLPRIDNWLFLATDFRCGYAWKSATRRPPNLPPTPLAFKEAANVEHSGSGRAIVRWDRRRELLRVGGLGMAGLSLADVLAAPGCLDRNRTRGKSVIMIWLRGGASHIDSYDMKPDAPAEIRGEFKPIKTNVPGIQVCEHMPLHAKMMDKLAVIRGIKSVDIGDHTPHYILTGFPDRGKRPVLGSVVSYLQPRSDGLPPYVSLMYKPPGLYDNEGPTYTRPGAPAVRAEGRGAGEPEPGEGRFARHAERPPRAARRVRRRQPRDRRDRRMAASTPYTRRAIEMIASPKVRDAFDLKKESPETHERYGKFCESFLMARRLVEAGRLGRHAARSATGTRTRRTSSTTRRSSRNSTRASTRWSATCTTAGWRRTWRW